MSDGEDHDVLSDAQRPEPVLFADLQNEADRPYFLMRTSGPDRLTGGDAELPGAAFPAPAKSGRRPLTAALVVLAAICGLAGAAPGSAAGLIPLAAGVIQFGAPAFAAVFALLAAGLALRGGKPRQDPLATVLKRRPIFPGTGTYRVSLGQSGLQLVYARRFWRARWSAFDASTLMTADMNGQGLPAITLAEADGVSLDDLLSRADTGAPAVEALIERAAAWAERHDVIRLPLKFDPDFAVRKGKSGTQRLFPAGQEREFLRLHKRQFSDPNEGDINWARFVAACVFMIQTHDPNWVDSIEGDDTDA